jgi:tetratricopeptide (TPR) repeat protein
VSQSPAGDANPLQESFSQALALHQRDAVQDAEKIYREILQQQPRHFHALRLSGVVALKTRNTERGVALLADAIKLNPRSAAARNDLGIGLVALDRLDEAIAIYDEAIALQPDNAQAHYNRGNALGPRHQRRHRGRALGRRARQTGMGAEPLRSMLALAVGQN